MIETSGGTLPSLFVMNSNSRKLYTSEIFSFIALLFTAGTMLQMFLISCGYSEQDISLYSGIGSTIQTCIMFASLFIADSLKGVKGIISLSRLAPIFTIFVLLLVRKTTLSPEIKLTLLLSSGVVTNLIFGISNILVYKFPLMVLGSEAYGRYLTSTGTISSVMTLTLSIFVSVFSGHVSMDLIMDIACVISLIGSLASAISNQSIRMSIKKAAGTDPAGTDLAEDDANRDTAVLEVQKVSLRETLRTFWYDLLPFDVLRGLAAGISGLLLVFATRYSLLDESGSAWYVLITRVASLAGYAFLLWFNQKRRSNAALILLCTLTNGILLPLMLLMKVQPLFLVMGFLLETLAIIISICVPVAISKRVPAAHMGVYTAKRMTAMTGGTALSSLIVSAFISRDHAWALLIISGVFQILFGLGYFIAIRRRPGLPEDE